MIFDHVPVTMEVVFQTVDNLHLPWQLSTKFLSNKNTVNSVSGKIDFIYHHKHLFFRLFGKLWKLMSKVKWSPTLHMRKNLKHAKHATCVQCSAMLKAKVQCHASCENMVPCFMWNVMQSLTPKVKSNKRSISPVGTMFAQAWKLLGKSWSNRVPAGTTDFWPNLARPYCAFKFHFAKLCCM